MPTEAERRQVRWIARGLWVLAALLVGVLVLVALPV